MKCKYRTIGVTTQPWEIHNRKSEVIAFVVNDGYRYYGMSNIAILDLFLFTLNDCLFVLYNCLFVFYNCSFVFYIILSSWKIYICNLMAWFTNKKWRFLWAQTPLIANLSLYCYERDFMSNLLKSKRFDLIDKFNDTCRYLDDIFTIDNPEFAEHIPVIYPRELQLNKGNTSDKETSFLNSNIKFIGSNTHKRWVSYS